MLLGGARFDVNIRREATVVAKRQGGVGSAFLTLQHNPRKASPSSPFAKGTGRLDIREASGGCLSNVQSLAPLEPDEDR